MATIPRYDLFGHLLDYQQTEEFKAEAEAHKEQKRATRRPGNRKGSDAYRRDHPDLVNMRARAQKHKPFLIKRQNGRCYYCRQVLGEDCEIDHIKALTKGGSNVLSNLCVACQRCNRKKGIK